MMHKTPTMMSSSVGGWDNKKSFNKFVDTRISKDESVDRLRTDTEVKNATFGMSRNFDEETTRLIASNSRRFANSKEGKMHLDWSTQRGARGKHKELMATHHESFTTRPSMKKRRTARLESTADKTSSRRLNLARDESQHILTHDILNMTTDYKKVDENITKLLKMSESKMLISQEETAS